METMDTDDTSDTWYGEETSSEDSNSSDDNIEWQNEELHPHCCVESKRDFKRMEKKLQSDPYSLNRSQESENQDQPLHVAIYCEHIKCVQFLLNEGADVDLVNYEGKTPLERAINTRTEVDTYQRILKLNIIIKLLLKHGADVNYVGSEFQSTYFLTQLLNRREMDMFKLFLDYGAKTEDLSAIQDADLYYETPIFNALNLFEFKVAKLLFLHGAIVNIHKLPISETYCSEHMPLLHKIIKNLNTENEQNSCRVIRLYREFGGDFHITFRGQTALEYLITEGWSGNLLTPSLLEDCASNPLSLQSICRLAIRTYMGREFKGNIVHLPLPREVRQHLKFKFE